MKHLLLAACLFTAAPALAQTAPPVGTEAAQPFKGANTILVHCPDSSTAALKKMARALIVGGIEPDKIETEIGYLSTKPKSVGQLSPANFEYKVVSMPEPGGTLLSITGTFTVKLNAVNSMTNAMYWAKGNLLQAKQCFMAIDEIAKTYPSGRIAYLQKR
jgi:hypothetical protein